MLWGLWGHKAIPVVLDRRESKAHKAPPDLLVPEGSQDLPVPPQSLKLVLFPRVFLLQ